jgi:arsenate reductase
LEKSLNQRKVLILCTGNSCRSQMAEAIINARLNEDWQAFSAGTKHAGYVHPYAIQLLLEIGIRHEGRSKHLDEYRQTSFDRVVTVCGMAAEDCPLWIGVGRRVLIGFPGPAKATGTEDEIMRAFRNVRDDIATRYLWSRYLWR